MYFNKLIIKIKYYFQFILKLNFVIWILSLRRDDLCFILSVHGKGLLDFASDRSTKRLLNLICRCVTDENGSADTDPLCLLLISEIRQPGFSRLEKRLCQANADRYSRYFERENFFARKHENKLKSFILN